MYINTLLRTPTPLPRRIPDPHFRTREEGFKNRKRHVKEEDKKFTVQEFTYNEKDNTYICPCGKVLPCKGEVKLNRNTGKVYRMKMETIETAFSDIEYCKGMDRLMLRSKKKVDGQ
jgi:hypothetical protein